MKTRRCYLIRPMTRIIAVLILCFLQGAFAQDCVDISGKWQVEESVTATISAEGETETVQKSGSGEITIEQYGCQISFYSQGLSPEGNIMLLRQGTVTNDHITFSGLMMAGNPEVSCSVNLFTGEGEIEGNTIYVTTTGSAVCSGDGITAFIVLSGTAVFTREVKVKLESIEVKNGILIREIPRKIWSKDEPSKLYPFAASMKQGTVTLHIKLSDVNNNYTYTPTVRCAYSWKPINGNPLVYQYPDEFEGWEGDIDIYIPQGANLYDLTLLVTVFYEGAGIYQMMFIDPEHSDRGITAYITFDEPVGPLVTRYPLELYLEKATRWAGGATGKEDILEKLVSGIYNEGRAAGWVYWPVNTSWAALLTNTVNRGDCHTMAELWVAMANTLGISGVGTYCTSGSNNYGFLTVSPAIAFDGNPGNAHPPGGQVDRWCFNYHYMGIIAGFWGRIFGYSVYYDPTVNNTYDRQFSGLIEVNATSNWNYVVGSPVSTQTFEREVFAERRRSGAVVDITYYLNPLGPQKMRNVSDLHDSASAIFNGVCNTIGIDGDSDGLFDQLEITIEIDVSEPGNFIVLGSVTANGAFVTNRSDKDTTEVSRTEIYAQGGINEVRIKFSGFDINRSGLDGPYGVKLYLLDATGMCIDEFAVNTEAYTASQFGETSADLVSINDSPVDIDGDLIFDSLRVETTVNVYRPGGYCLDATLFTPDGAIIDSVYPDSVLSSGSQVVTLDFDGRELSTIQDPNFLKLEITINDSEGEQQDHGTFTTNIYDPANFIKKDVSITGPYSDILYDPDNDGLIDTLRVEVGVEVTEPNNYQVAAWLQDSNGCDITTSRSNIDLGVGKQNITIDFEGQNIREHGVDGPYSIIYLLVENGEGIVDSKREVYLTDGYHFADFNPATGGIQEDFETGDFDIFEWVLSGDSDWIVTQDEHKSGTYSAKAGPIGNNGSTTLKLTLDCASGDISFYYKVSSEQHYDYLRFYIDGTLQDEWSGNEDWTQVSFPVEAGSRTFEWTYSKDGSSSYGSDTAWVDDIEFPCN